MKTFLICMALWCLLGPLFANSWRRLNELELYFNAVPAWKIWVVFVIGGPVVWLMALLS